MSSSRVKSVVEADSVVAAQLNLPRSEPSVPSGHSNSKSFISTEMFESWMSLELTLDPPPPPAPSILLLANQLLSLRQVALKSCNTNELCSLRSPRPSTWQQATTASGSSSCCCSTEPTSTPKTKGGWSLTTLATITGALCECVLW